MEMIKYPSKTTLEQNYCQKIFLYSQQDIDTVVYDLFCEVKLFFHQGLYIVW